MPITANVCKRCRSSWIADKSENLCKNCLAHDELELHASENEPIVIGGQDFGRLHDYSTLVGIKVHRGKADVIGVKAWPHVDYSLVTKETVAIYHKEGMRLLAIDATDSMTEPIQTQYHQEGVVTADIKFGDYIDWTNPMGVIEHSGIKHAMIEYARACLQEHLVNLPKTGTNPTSDELLKQLREQEIVKGSAGSTGLEGATRKVIYGHPSSQHDDLAWAFLMSLYVSRPFLTGSGVFGYVAYSNRKDSTVLH